MAYYKRQYWTSGYAYRIRCPQCGTVTEYRDNQLGYRAWYPNGFIYCSYCRMPLRHNEIYAINPDGSAVYSTQAEADLAITEGYMRACGIPPVAPAPGVVVTPPPAQAEAPAAEAPASGTAFCTNCGRRYTVGKDHFCNSCGKKLD